MYSTKHLPTAAIISMAVILAGAVLVTAFDIMLVDGHSMEPTIRPGQVLVINRLAYGIQPPLHAGYILRWGHPVPGDIVVFRNPREGRIVVKRCSTLDENAAVFALGDNSVDSIDSRQYGFIPAADILGKILF